MLNLLARMSGLLALTDFEIRKLFRRKLAHTGIIVSLFLTVLSALGIAMRMNSKHNEKMLGRLVSEMMNGFAFSETVLLPAIYMLLPMVVGIFSAISFAGELQGGFLRTVAIRPVSRLQIFFSKFITMSVYSYILLFILLVVSYITGSLLFGPSGDIIVFGPAFLGHGAKIFIMPAEVAFQRLLLSYIFAGYSLISLSAMFLMFSAVFKKTAIATVIPLGIYYTSYILDALPFMESLQRFLPTRYLMVWKYVMAENIAWESMLHDGAILSLYTLAYLAVGAIVFSQSEL